MREVYRAGHAAEPDNSRVVGNSYLGITSGLLVTREKAPHSYHFVVNPSHFSAHRAATPRTDNHPFTWSVSEIRVTSPL